MRSRQHGFTLIELLVVIAIIAILASILFPVFAKAREQARKATCTSNIRQLSVAIQMYVQDNGSQYPGVDGGSSWAAKIATYVGNSEKMFQCPSDTEKSSGANSYAMSGLLVKPNGQGILEAGVNSTSEVGCLVDASPSQTYPAGNLVESGGGSTAAAIGAVPTGRHSKGAVAGFCDGHAKFFAGPFNKYDTGNGVARAFYQVAPFGLVNNPVGGIDATAGFSASNVTVGGEYATMPFLLAAAQTQSAYFSRGFNGYNSTAGRPTSEYAWGYTGLYVGQTTCIAMDALCVIVSKVSKIPGIGGQVNQTYALGTATMRNLFNLGYQSGTVQAYQMPAASLSRGQIAYLLGSGVGPDSLEVANDLEMVEKVSNDQYAIGYCSSAFADPDRVSVVGIVAGGTTQFWPRNSSKFRWVGYATAAESSWPWKRIIEVTAAGTTGTNLNAALHGAFQTALMNGPLASGYWKGLGVP